MSLLRIAAIKASLAATWTDYQSRRLFGRLASDADINAWIAAHQFKQPADLGIAMATEFKWRADGFMDYAKHPRAFFADKQDDCDGFALFAEHVCGKLGWPAYRVYVKASSDRAHVVCVTGGWQVGNWQPFSLTGTKLSEIAQQIAQHMGGNMSYALKFIGNSYQEYAAD